MCLRLTTARGFRGPGLTAVGEGLPGGLEPTPEDLDADHGGDHVDDACRALNAHEERIGWKR